MGFVEEMKERGLVAQITHEDELIEHCNSGVRTAYIGFDPTADSLHVGHLTQIMTLYRWQKAGHRVVALMGGGTALVGDPTGKTEMRNMLSQEQIDHNIAAFERQVKPLLDFSDPKKGIIVNNADWLLPLNYLEFLREFGSCFSVNRMLTAECFKARLEKGLSFLEFNYMLLQAYDFYHLYNAEDCTVQLGGDDQWSNILAGADLIRRKVEGSKAFCLTVPLLATSDGKKMGKTEKGAVWIDPTKTSPYEYYQYWRNVPDDMVGQCMRIFTKLDMKEIQEWDAKQGAALNEAKKVLAAEATAMIHGEAAAKQAEATAAELFGGSGGGGNEPVFELPLSDLQAGLALADVLVKAGVFASKSEARRLIEQGGLTANGKKVQDFKAVASEALLDDKGAILIRKGKKHYYRLVFS